MKKIIALMLAAGLVLSLCACGNKGTGTVGTEPVQGVTDETSAAAEEITEAEYKAAYQEVLRTYLKENGMRGDTYFSFCYVDDDDVPELVLCPGQFHAAEALLYTYDGEKVIDLGGYGQYGTMEYVPETGIILHYGMWQGSEYHTYYKLENGEVSELSAVSRIPQSILVEDLIYDWFINETPVTEEEYNAELEKYEAYGEYVAAPVDYNFSDDENIPEGVYKLNYQNVYGLTRATLNFADMPTEFYFSSGAGAWGDIITLHADGTFEGVFTDHDYKVCYYSTYSGSFGEPVKVDEYSYSVEIQNLEVTNDREKALYDDDEAEYIEAEPYGIENADRLIVYLPGTPLTELTEDCISWLHLNENAKAIPHDMFVLYNEAEGHAFTGTLDLD